MDRHARKSGATAQQSQMAQLLDQSTFKSATRTGTALDPYNKRSVTK